MSNVDTAGVVVLVVANYGYRQMLANWMCHAGVCMCSKAAVVNSEEW
jgi:hypothetical protein